jgi:hypothetical protein
MTQKFTISESKGHVGHYRKDKLSGGLGCRRFPVDLKKPLLEQGCFSCPYDDCIRDCGNMKVDNVRDS